MPVSRPVVLALAGAILALAAFFATSGARNSDSGGTAVAPQAESARPVERAGSKSPAGQETKAEPASSRSANAESRSSDPTSEPTQAEPALPPAVERAVAGKRTVVLFFRQRGSPTTTPSRAPWPAFVVATWPSSPPPSRVSTDYAAITTSIVISQAPAVVIVGRNNKARLIEGFVDEETLAQEVADAR